MPHPTPPHPIISVASRTSASLLTFAWTCWGSWCYADDGVGWGGVGHANVRVNLLRFLMLRWWWGGVGWGMLTFAWTCWGSWCYADDGVGWGGVGHVNVRVNLLRFLMLRWWWGGGGVGWGMLTFAWTCWGSWCYADDGVGWGGVGWGMLTFVWTCWGPWCYADDGVGWGGVGHVNVRVNLLSMPELVWSRNCVSPRRNTHLSKKPPNSDVWISEFLWSPNCVFA